MRIIVFFDLPVKTKEERRAHGHFRKFLIADGYDRLQLSVYSRVVPNEEAVETYLRRLQRQIPTQGSIRFLRVTDRQYGAMKILLGTKTKKEKYLNSDQMLLF